MTYRREFIAKIIEDKVARFVCEGLDEMTAAIQHIPAIARRRWRLYSSGDSAAFRSPAHIPGDSLALFVS